MAHAPKKLGPLAATAIAGNDITSSCLYVGAIAMGYAGPWAVVALIIVAGVLFLFRKIYGEVVGALPLNGGAYNVLLNTTNKYNASIAACLTILSYMATAVLSASTAMYYLHALVPAIPVLIATGVVLAIFMLLSIAGMTESSVVAIIIFIAHLVTMGLLICASIWFVTQHGLHLFSLNWSLPLPEGRGIAAALFFGFSTAMLGVTGFESSANYVEEQEHGVFPKTLRNMWVAVSVLNPLIVLCAIMVLPMSAIGEHEETMLSFMGLTIGGNWLATVITVDAVVVLCGAVLTSYVGVSGLIKRMTLDRIMPQFLLKETKQGSSPRIIILFFLLCLSVLFLTNAETAALAGVYTISFLTVMAFFAIGNFLLKMKRARLPRPETASVAAVSVALMGVVLALYGNVRLHPEFLVVFLQYFIPTMLVIAVMLNRKAILEVLMAWMSRFVESVPGLAVIGRFAISRTIRKLNSQEFVYFTKGDDLSILNRVMMYVQANEITKKLRIVTVLKEGEKMHEEYLRDMEVLDRAYPEIKIEFTEMHGVFGPELVHRLSEEWNIPTNFMFIGSPSNRFPYRVAELGGVRLVI
ncbi:MAG: APC family permease [Flavobacteriales bacterium]|jgi:amino acid transporter|nr:APC family permease [Flavobacteriales bacterium]MBK6891958.1 APC family permease [Flavobacteriales bacterium]MBK7246096.1 APC family permease [Flavobacteriales bacterium]MBK9598788.1 APC family permease [Flavobacteriales bacterium]QQS71800.1 MAG: APC family permease [Flavobacteriales bacterium]